MDTTKNNIDFDVIISTCDKFSDLWDANVLLLNQNWRSRGQHTYLVTDKMTDKVLEGVEIISAGEGREITKRLECALQKVKAKYLLFTLDDYFLTTPIDNQKIQNALEFMEREQIDYVRLYPKSQRKLKREGVQTFANYKDFYLRDTSKGTYKISLYPGLWRTDFMRQTVHEEMNAWEYEVALTPMANALNAKCAISNRNEFPFLDVIRKGKVLRQADRYFKKNPIYKSNRRVLTRRETLKLDIREWLHYNLPKPMLRCLKLFLIKCGIKFFSPVE